MGNTTYYFGSNKNETDLNAIVSNPLFQKLVNYFSENEEKVILRQIKAEIQTDSNLELYLDKLIEYNLIERKNRRYSLAFPIYSEETSATIPDAIVVSLQNLIKEKEVITNDYILGEWLWSLFFEEEQGTYFFGVENSLNNIPVFLSKREEGNEALRFVSIFPDTLMPLDLANYFNLLSKRQALPEKFAPLQNLIGDVDINYYISQIQKVIRSVQRNKSRDNKINIFQETLMVTGDLKRDEQNQLIFATPILANYTPSIELQVPLNSLKEKLTSLWALIEDENQRVFFKKQLYSVLIKECLLGKELIRYFKI